MYLTYSVTQDLGGRIKRISSLRPAYEILSQKQMHDRKKLHVSVTPVLDVWEIEGEWVQDQSLLHSEFQASLNYMSQAKQKWGGGGIGLIAVPRNWKQVSTQTQVEF